MNKRRQSISGFPKVKFMERSPGISAIECMPSQFFTQAQTVCSIHFRFSAPLDCTLISGFLTQHPWVPERKSVPREFPQHAKLFIDLYRSTSCISCRCRRGRGRCGQYSFLLQIPWRHGIPW